MNNLSQILHDNISCTFIAFFRDGITHFLKSETSLDDKILCVFSLQEAMELLVKLYFLEERGYVSILIKKHKTNTEEQNLQLFQNQDLKTLGYGELLEDLKSENDCPLSTDDFDLLEEFQKARNQIAHIGFKYISDELVSSAIDLIISVFSDLKYDERIRNNESEELRNILKELLGDDLFYDFTNKVRVRTRIENKLKTKFTETHYCLDCECNTVINRNFRYKCLLCGYQVSSYLVEPILCPDCDTKSLYIDKLNTSPDNDSKGYCPCCSAELYVSQCKTCKQYYVIDVQKCKCNK